jgi:3-oxoadipate enol-lactonase
MKVCKLISVTTVLGLLSAALPAAPTQWAEANGVHLRYELSGRGKDTVVLLHEVSTSLESWDFVVPELERTHRLLRYDLRGFGLSERTHGTLSMDDEMEDLRGLLAVLGIHDKVTLVGGALGGAIALNFAAAHPDLVSGVVAISPAAYMKRGGLNGNLTNSAGTTVAPPAASAASPTASPLEAAYPLALQLAHPDRIARFRAIQAASDQASSAASLPAAYDVAFAEVLQRIQCPAMIVATSQWIRPVSSFKELADAIPHGEFTVIDTGHFAAMESPELLVPVLEHFLDKRRARSQ